MTQSPDSVAERTILEKLIIATPTILVNNDVVVGGAVAAAVVNVSRVHFTDELNAHINRQRERNRI